MIRGIKIDVIKGEVYEVWYDGRSLKETYELLNCRIVQVATIRENEDAYMVDEEGMFREPPLGAFKTQDYPGLLSGHALVVGCDEEGNTVSCKSTVEEIAALVSFHDPKLLKGIPTEPVIIALTDTEWIEYMTTGKLPLGKRPPNLN